MSLGAVWDGLDVPVRRSLELAWEAYLAGSIPVGCVLTDSRGDIVIEGRNRAFEEASPKARISGTYIAHAEINVLAMLPPGDYDDHTLWTSLEPCFLCSAAIVHSHIGSVCYVAADPLMSGTDRLPELNDWVASRWPNRSGPFRDSADDFSSLLHLAFFADVRPGGVVTTAYAKRDPVMLEIAARVAAHGLLDSVYNAREAFVVLCEEMSHGPSGE